MASPHSPLRVRTWELNNKDRLELRDKPEVQKMLQKHQDESKAIQFTGNVIKINRHNVRQDRRIIITKTSIYTLKPASYVPKRNIPISSIASIIISRKSEEFVIKLPATYDLHLSSGLKVTIARLLRNLHHRLSNHFLKIDSVSQNDLKTLCVTKSMSKDQKSAIMERVNARIRTIDQLGKSGELDPLDVYSDDETSMMNTLSPGRHRFISTSSPPDRQSTSRSRAFSTEHKRGEKQINVSLGQEPRRSSQPPIKPPPCSEMTASTGRIKTAGSGSIFGSGFFSRLTQSLKLQPQTRKNSSNEKLKGDETSPKSSASVSRGESSSCQPQNSVNSRETRSGFFKTNNKDSSRVESSSPFSSFKIRFGPRKKNKKRTDPREKERNHESQQLERKVKENFKNDSGSYASSTHEQSFPKAKRIILNHSQNVNPNGPVGDHSTTPAQYDQSKAALEDSTAPDRQIRHHRQNVIGGYLHNSVNSYKKDEVNNILEIERKNSLRQQQKLKTVQIDINPKRRIKRHSMTRDLPSMKHWNTDVTLKDFKALQTIGENSYGLTMKVARKATGTIHILKLLKKDEVHRGGKLSSIENERKLLLQMKHPLIIKLDHSFQALDFLGLVYQYTQNVDLYYHLQRVRRFPESIVRVQVAEIISAVGFLHSRGYIHRDVRPENVLVDGKGHTRLTGLGLAKNVGVRAGDVMFPSTNTFCGTVEYLAPEMLFNKSEHDIRADWWAVGVLLYELTSGIPPFYSRSVKRLYHRILNAKPKLYPFLSAHCKDLLQQLLQKDRTQRKGTSGDSNEILKHQFFYKMTDTGLKARAYPIPWNERNKPMHSNPNHSLASTFQRKMNVSVPQPMKPRAKKHNELDAAPLNPSESSSRDASRDGCHDTKTVKTIVSLSSSMSTPAPSTLVTPIGRDAPPSPYNFDTARKAADTAKGDMNEVADTSRSHHNGKPHSTQPPRSPRARNRVKTNVWKGNSIGGQANRSRSSSPVGHSRTSRQQYDYENAVSDGVGPNPGNADQNIRVNEEKEQAASKANSLNSKITSGKNVTVETQRRKFERRRKPKKLDQTETKDNENQIHAGRKLVARHERKASAVSLGTPSKGHKRCISNVSEDSSLAFTQGSLAGKLGILEVSDGKRNSSHRRPDDQGPALGDGKNEDIQPLGIEENTPGKILIGAVPNPLQISSMNHREQAAAQVRDIRAEIATLQARLKRLEDAEKRILSSGTGSRYNSRFNSRSSSRRNSAGELLAHSLAEALSEENLIDDIFTTRRDSLLQSDSILRNGERNSSVTATSGQALEISTDSILIDNQ